MKFDSHSFTPGSFWKKLAPKARSMGRDTVKIRQQAPQSRNDA